MPWKVTADRPPRPKVFKNFLELGLFRREKKACLGFFLGFLGFRVLGLGGVYGAGFSVDFGGGGGGGGGALYRVLAQLGRPSPP